METPAASRKTGASTSWPLVAVAYAFGITGAAINVWSAWTIGDWAATALPATLGVLSEAVLFFLPARLPALPVPRRALAVLVLAFMAVFAAANGLRMASIVATDQAAARADRVTAGIRAAGEQLDLARAARDAACGRGQGKTVACTSRQAEVLRLEQARTAAVGRVAEQAKPEAGDFAKLVTWITAGAVKPTGDDYTMMLLAFRTFLPLVGGLVLLLARK